MNYYTFSDIRSAKSCIKIEQKPETVQYIENNAARMGVSVQIVVDAMITAQYNSIKYHERAKKSPIDLKTYELRKQLELAQYRPANEVINWNGYSIKAGEAANILKRLNSEFTKPSKNQLLLFEAEIAADAAPVQEQQPEPAPAPVEDIEAANTHFDDLAANAPADDFTPHIEENGDLHYENYTVKGPDSNAVSFGSYIPAGLLQPTPTDEKPEPEPAPVKKTDTPAEIVINLCERIYNDTTEAVAVGDAVIYNKFKGEIPRRAVITGYDDKIKLYFLKTDDGEFIATERDGFAPAGPTPTSEKTAPTPTSEKTEPEPAPVKKAKELAEYHGAIVEIVERRENFTTAIKFKFGSRALALNNELKPTTAKKTALPEWLQSHCILETDYGQIKLDTVGQKNISYYGIDGYYYNGLLPHFIRIYGDNVKQWHFDPEFKPEDPEPDPDAIGFKIGESVILAADVLGKSHDAVKCTVTEYSFSEKIGAVVYNLKGEDGNIYAGTESDIIAAPTDEKTAPTDAELIEAAARIRANYEAIMAEAEPPAPVTYTEEQVQRMVADAVAAALNEEKAKRRQGRISRLSRLLHPARWVALAFVACVLVGLLTGANRRTAEAAPDDIAAVIHLRPVTITAKAPQTFINKKPLTLLNKKPQTLLNKKSDALLTNEPTAHIEEESPDTAPVKKLAAAEASSQKPAPDNLNTAPDAAGLTVCAGTPWAYTMMNWA